MKRYLLTDTPADEHREQFYILRAADPGTKTDIGWRMKNAVWVYEKGDDKEPAPLAFHYDVEEIIESISQKEL